MLRGRYAGLEHQGRMVAGHNDGRRLRTDNDDMLDRLHGDDFLYRTARNFLVIFMLDLICHHFAAGIALLPHHRPSHGHVRIFDFLTLHWNFFLTGINGLADAGDKNLGIGGNRGTWVWHYDVIRKRLDILFL